MVSKQRRWHGYLRALSGAIALAVWLLSVGVALAGAPARPYRVAVLTPGLLFNLALEGLREGLTQLGYHEERDITFLVEDAQGDVASLSGRAANIVEAKPDVIFTVGTVA